MKKRFGKKALSPVIATVLLIAMTMVIGLIVFLWFKGLTEEQITKFGGTNIKLVCDDVYFEAEYVSSSGTLSILNSGNIPIYNFKIKESGQGSFTTSDIGDLSSSWKNQFSTGLNQGAVFSDEISFSGYEEVILIPVLIGNTEKGKKTYVCDENLHGYKLIL